MQFLTLALRLLLSGRIALDSAEELLAGAGMNGFLGVLDPPVLTTPLEKLVGEVDPLSANPQCDSGAAQVDKVGWDDACSEMSARVASVVLKVEALMELIEATSKNYYGETKMDDFPLSLDIQSEGGEKTK